MKRLYNHNTVLPQCVPIQRARTLICSQACMSATYVVAQSTVVFCYHVQESWASLKHQFITAWERCESSRFSHYITCITPNYKTICFFEWTKYTKHTFQGPSLLFAIGTLASLPLNKHYFHCVMRWPQIYFTNIFMYVWELQLQLHVESNKMLRKIYVVKTKSTYIFQLRGQQYQEESKIQPCYISEFFTRCTYKAKLTWS